jgi:hypothetical protein
MEAAQKWGGKREGAGRKKGIAVQRGYKAKQHNFRCSDKEWAMLTEAAARRGISAVEWIRRAVWQTDMRTGESIGLNKLPW